MSTRAPRRIGYVCQNLTLGTRTRTCRLARCTPERAVDLARENLRDVEAIARWNADRGIRMFRITSGVVPFGSIPPSGDWRGALAEDFARVGETLRSLDQRVSTHPGQFVVLGSQDERALRASREELAYHADFLDLMGVEGEMVVHLGGAYGDPASALDRFVDRVRSLPANVRRRLVVENDDRVFGAGAAIATGRRAGVRVVLDVLHHALLPTPGLEKLDALRAALRTWPDGPRAPKIHYSDAAPGGPRGAHARRVDPRRFARFLDEAAGLRFDVMVEAKDKEHALLPLLRTTSGPGAPIAKSAKRRAAPQGASTEPRG